MVFQVETEGHRLALLGSEEALKTGRESSINLQALVFSSLSN